MSRERIEAADREGWSTFLEDRWRRVNENLPKDMPPEVRGLLLSAFMAGSGVTTEALLAVRDDRYLRGVAGALHAECATWVAIQKAQEG